MTKYSGRTTAYEHKRENWQEYKGPFKSSIQNKIIFEVQWSDCPVEVEKEVKKLWSDYELGNDHSYINWESEEQGQDYPIIDEYLKSKNITECLIHWWW